MSLELLLEVLKLLRLRRIQTTTFKSAALYLQTYQPGRDLRLFCFSAKLLSVTVEQCFLVKSHIEHEKTNLLLFIHYG